MHGSARLDVHHLSNVTLRIESKKWPVPQFSIRQGRIKDGVNKKRRAGIKLSGIQGFEMIERLGYGFLFVWIVIKFLRVRKGFRTISGNNHSQI